MEPDAIKQLSKESLSLILNSIPHGVLNESSEVLSSLPVLRRCLFLISITGDRKQLVEISRCKEYVQQQHAEISHVQQETQRALEALELTLAGARSNHWHMYAKELQELQSVIPPVSALAPHHDLSLVLL